MAATMLDWQTGVALAIFGLAAAYLLRHAYRFTTGQGKSGCSTCPSKSVTSPLKTIPLVQLTAPSKPSKRPN